MASTNSPPLLETLSNLAPASLSKFDAFPKLPAIYKARSESRGFMTIFVTFLAVFLLLNDVSEFLWGWPDYEFSLDRDVNPNLEINLDMVVAMPCAFITIDLRDAMGDRLFLSGSLRREGTFFDAKQATELKEHAQALSVSQAVAQSRKSRGLFSWLFWNSKPSFKRRYNYQTDGDACRITGSLTVKRVTANLHITTIGHGYTSYEHVDHNKMNLSHVITEFSFGPFFPEIVQPLDNSFESTDKHFLAYQYFLHVVPTTYIAPRSPPLHTAQYGVTHYTREVSHDSGTPGIFFKFDLDPLALTIHQRTTSFLHLLIRCVGVLGGVFVCMGYAIRVTNRAVEVVNGGADGSGGIVAAESSGVRVGLRAKWGGGELRSRVGKSAIPQGSGWTVDGGPLTASSYAGYTGTPISGGFSPALGGGMSSHSPYLASPNTASLPPYSPRPYSPNLAAGSLSPGMMRSTSASVGLGPPPRSAMSASFGPRSTSASSSPFGFPTSPMPTAATFGSSVPATALSEASVSVDGRGHEHAYSNGDVNEETLSRTPGVGYATLPLSPNPAATDAFRMAPVPGKRGNGIGEAKKED